jgi:hypothetical protein
MTQVEPHYIATEPKDPKRFALIAIPGSATWAVYDCLAEARCVVFTSVKSDHAQDVREVFRKAARGALLQESAPFRDAVNARVALFEEPWHLARVLWGRHDAAGANAARQLSSYLCSVITAWELEQYYEPALAQAELAQAAQKLEALPEWARMGL